MALCLAASWSPSWEQNGAKGSERFERINEVHHGEPHREDLAGSCTILQKSMILQNDSKWNIDDIDEHSTVGQQILKVQSFTQKILIGRQGMSRQSRSTHTVGRGSSRAKCWFRSGRSLMCFLRLRRKLLAAAGQKQSDSAETYRPKC